MVRNLGRQPRRARIFHSPSRLTVSKALVRSTKIMSLVPLLDLNPHWPSGVFSCAIIRMSLFSKTRAKILPAIDSRVMPQ